MLYLQYVYMCKHACGRIYLRSLMDNLVLGALRVQSYYFVQIQLPFGYWLKDGCCLCRDFCFLWKCNFFLNFLPLTTLIFLQE